ncbi:hypothetical protein [uncultured Arthrobacter sp.]|uniref:hypothetical protein n=1 Tax=uncultured Arthrobacter sp. TaxID=114050 RepID=UPI003217E74A
MSEAEIASLVTPFAISKVFGTEGSLVVVAGAAALGPSGCKMHNSLRGSNLIAAGSTGLN